MSQFCIDIADLVFSVKTVYSFTREVCKDYLTDKAPEVFIEITDEDIKNEKINTDNQLKREGKPLMEFSPEKYEFTAVYRKIGEQLLSRKAIIFHGALIQKDKKGYIFTAKSGTGKTTHILNWKKQFPDCQIINGDKPIIRLTDKGLFAYGTPWSGKENLQIPSKTPLKAIILLERGIQNSIEEISLGEALVTLLEQSNLPYGSKSLSDVTTFFCNMYGDVKFFRLLCNKDVSSAVTAFETLSKT